MIYARSLFFVVVREGCLRASYACSPTANPAHMRAPRTKCRPPGYGATSDVFIKHLSELRTPPLLIWFFNISCPCCKHGMGGSVRPLRSFQKVSYVRLGLNISQPVIGPSRSTLSCYSFSHSSLALQSPILFSLSLTFPMPLGSFLRSSTLKLSMNATMLKSSRVRAVLAHQALISLPRM